MPWGLGPCLAFVLGQTAEAAMLRSLPVCLLGWNNQEAWQAYAACLCKQARHQCSKALPLSTQQRYQMLWGP